MSPISRFVLPSLGNPAFLSADRRSFSALISLEDALISESGFRLTPVHGPAAGSIALRTEAIREVSSLPIDTPLNRELAHLPKRFTYTLDLLIEPSLSPLGNFRYVLFNLTHPQIETAYHSVVFAFHHWETCRILFVADIHVAARWEEIQSAISALDATATPATDFSQLFSAEVFRDSFVDPNRNLVDLIRKANARAESGDLDLLIVGGDLVDYKYRQFRAAADASYSATNFSLFEEYVTGRTAEQIELEVPILTTSGNHDYRLFPYLIAGYGLKHCGLHEYQTDFLRAETLPQEPRRLGRADIDSIRTGEVERHRTPLHHYLWHLNPQSDFSLVLGTTKFIFLDTGRDVWMTPGGIHPRRYPNLVRNIFFGVSDPDSEAFSRQQIDFLRREIEGWDHGRILLIFHASLLNPSRLTGDEELRPLLDLEPFLNRSDDAGREVRFESWIKAKRLSVGCVFQGQLALFAEASRVDRRILGLSGHLHKRFRFAVDKDRQEVLYSRSAASIAAPFSARQSYFLTAASLAHPQTKDAFLCEPEFYDIAIGEESGDTVRIEPLDAPPLDRFHFSLSTLRTERNRLEFQASPRDARGEGGIEVVVHLLVIAKRRIERSSIMLQTLPETVIDGRLVEPEDAFRFLPRARGIVHYRLHSALSGTILFRLANLGHQGRLEVVGIAQFLRAEGNETLRFCWYPRSLYLK